MKCPHCSADVYETDSVCMSCGQELRRAGAAPPPPPPAKAEWRPAPVTRARSDGGWIVKLIVWAVVAAPVVAITYYGCAGVTDLMVHGDWRLEDNTMLRIVRTPQGSRQLVRYWDFGSAVEKEYDGDHKGRVASTRLTLTAKPYMVEGEKAVLWPGYEEIKGDLYERDKALTKREKAERLQTDAADRPAYCYLTFEDIEYRFVFPNRVRIRTTKPGKLEWTIHGLTGTPRDNTWEATAKAAALKRSPAHYMGKAEGEESYTLAWGSGKLSLSGSKTGQGTWKSPDYY